MNICHVAPEMAPYVKTGGLGDVVGALPKVQAGEGHSVIVMIPFYRNLVATSQRPRPVEFRESITVGGREHPVLVQRVREPRSPVDVYMIGSDAYFARDGIYTDVATGQNYADNDERFIFFNRAVLRLLRALQFRPDIIHVHDWQTALIPVYLKEGVPRDEQLANASTVLTIHNLAYQGVFPPERYTLLDLPDTLFRPVTGQFEFYGNVNFLKAGILFADGITTVSEKYAGEIQTEECGCGLEGVLRGRAADITGILNGVDYTIWSPSRDRKLPFNYHVANLSGKRMNKVELLNEAKLPIRDQAPLIGLISRLVDQKGIDLVVAAADRLLAMNVQMLVLGLGDRKYHDLCAQLQDKYPDKFRAFLTFDDRLAHQIEAASDIFLMPSRFEPSGLNQLFSLKYGTVPVVRKVGGLADTVVDYNADTGEGTGFVFEEYTPEAMLSALERAVWVFRKKRVWTRIMKACMRQDFSWRQSAAKYLKLYQNLRE